MKKILACASLGLAACVGANYLWQVEYTGSEYINQLHHFGSDHVYISSAFDDVEINRVTSEGEINNVGSFQLPEGLLVRYREWVDENSLYMVTRRSFGENNGGVGYATLNDGLLWHTDYSELASSWGVGDREIVFIESNIKQTPRNTALITGHFRFDGFTYMGYVVEFSQQGEILNQQAIDNSRAYLVQVQDDGYIVEWRGSNGSAYYIAQKTDWEGNIEFEKTLESNQSFELASDDLYFISERNDDIAEVVALDWNDQESYRFLPAETFASSANYRISSDGDLLLYNRLSGIEKRSLSNGALEWSRDFDDNGNYLIVKDDGTYLRDVVTYHYNANGIVARLEQTPGGSIFLDATGVVDIYSKISYEVMGPSDQEPKLSTQQGAVIRFYSTDCIIWPFNLNTANFDSVMGDVGPQGSTCAPDAEVVIAGVNSIRGIALFEDDSVVSLTQNLPKGGVFDSMDPIVTVTRLQ